MYSLIREYAVDYSRRMRRTVRMYLLINHMHSGVKL